MSDQGWHFPGGMKLARMALVFLAVAAGCAGGNGTSSSVDFWRAFEIHGDWVEEYSSLSMLVDAADAVVVAKVESVEMGATIQGDAREDVSFEFILRGIVLEQIRGPSVREVQITFVVPNAQSEEQSASLLARLRSHIPRESFVAMLRQRQSGLYRAVNGDSIWTPTKRASIDASLNPFLPHDGPFADEIAMFSDLDEMIDSLH